MEKFLEIVADALQKDLEEVHFDDKFRDYEEWDSIAVLSLGAAIHTEFGVLIPRNAYDNLMTLDDIRVYVESHK
jgi:acyl carrier protein